MRPPSIEIKLVFTRRKYLALFSSSVARVYL
jgi:hypothetical protein